MLILFGSGRILAEMLASGQGWKLGDWDTMVEPSTEASQMQLLVFPALSKRGEHIRGELGNGQKQQPSRSHTTTSEAWSEGRRTTTQQGRGKKLTYEISEKDLSWGSRCAQRIDSAGGQLRAYSMERLRVILTALSRKSASRQFS